VLTDRKALKHLAKKVKTGRWTQGTAVVLLFHAGWCPYSQTLLPLVECLPQHFPSSQIQFFSIDESDVGLRTVIQLGVDSFPMLQVVQPHPLREFGHSVALSGPRQLQHIVDRVAKITGVAPCTMQDYNQLAAKATCPVLKITAGTRSPECTLAENRTYSKSWGVSDWDSAVQCERLLREDEAQPVLQHQDVLGWISLAFVVVRFAYPWVQRHQLGGNAEPAAVPPHAAAD